jgi:hypothetical protein
MLADKENEISLCKNDDSSMCAKLLRRKVFCHLLQKTSFLPAFGGVKIMIVFSSRSTLRRPSTGEEWQFVEVLAPFSMLRVKNCAAAGPNVSPTQVAVDGRIPPETAMHARTFIN